MSQPKDGKKSERKEIRFSAAQLERIDAWRRRQRSIPNRNEAIRLLIDIGLGRATSQENPEE